MFATLIINLIDYLIFNWKDRIFLRLIISICNIKLWKISNFSSPKYWLTILLKQLQIELRATSSATTSIPLSLDLQNHFIPEWVSVNIAAEIDKHHRSRFVRSLSPIFELERAKKKERIYIYKREKENKKIKLSVRSEQNRGYQSAVTIPLPR